MKKTIETSMKTIAQPEDLKVVEVIISGFNYWDGYFGKMCKLKLGLKYKEFTTLEDDLKFFMKNCSISVGYFSIKDLASLKRSLMMLRSRYQTNCSVSDLFFINFLNDSINNIDKWVNEVIDAIVCEIS